MAAIIVFRFFLNYFQLARKVLGKVVGQKKKKKKKATLENSDNSDQCVKTAAHLNLDPQKECKLVITRKVGLS